MLSQASIDNDQLLHSLFEFNPHAIAVINRTGQFIKVNIAARELSGYSDSELDGAPFDKIILQDEHKKVLAYSLRAFGGVIQTFETAFVHKEGYRIDLSATLIPVRNSTEVQSLVVILQDISVSKRALERIKFMAHYDDMTGIPNRRYFRDHLLTALDVASNSNSSLAVLIIDLDRFKLYNDSFGHDVGNMLLLQVAERLMHCVSEGDVLARMDGDEFAIFYKHTGGIDNVEKLVEHIYEQLEHPFQYQGYHLHITASIGICINTNREITAEEMMKNANIAVSRAKEMGRNTAQFFTTSMEEGTLDRLKNESDLRLAILRDEFELYYQPQVDLYTGEIVGVESLLRWNHPDRGLITPDHFIPILEESGLIIPVGEKVIEWACRQNVAWQQEGSLKFPVAVNLSVKQFLQPNIVDRIRDILYLTGLEPAYLELEITESVTLDVEHVENVLNELKKLGVGISIDDFGTGYSSLRYLRRFPISRLKIDRSFVRDIMSNHNDAQIVQTIIAMARHLNMNVIAEGVETVEQINYLRTHQCMEIQGYHISRPLPVSAITKWMNEWQPTRITNQLP